MVQISKQVSKSASKQASKQTSKQANMRASKQASMRAIEPTSWEQSKNASDPTHHVGRSQPQISMLPDASIFRSTKIGWIDGQHNQICDSGKIFGQDKNHILNERWRYGRRKVTIHDIPKGAKHTQNTIQNCPTPKARTPTQNRPVFISRRSEAGRLGTQKIQNAKQNYPQIGAP